MKRLSILVVTLAVLLCAPARAAEPTPETAIPEGVVIGNVPVGGLTAEAAAEYVRTQFALPLVVGYGTYILEAPTQSLAAPSIQKAVQQAVVAPPNTIVPLTVTVRKPALRAYVADVSSRFARKPVDARLFLRKLKPWIAPEKDGREIDRTAAESALTSALVEGNRGPVVLKPKLVKAKLTRKSFGPVVVIKRGTNALSLYQGMRFVRSFGVATGQRQYPTPLGRFRVVVKWKHPWWYPPDSPWANGKEPVPPGPGNPLGTRWMGISSPGVGIHGTPEPGSIGYSVSHGCIRMRIPDAEWLFARIPVGTTVFIVSA
ncbi:MAG: L,D-transpeptidase family protein [Actinomycetota bacterium]